jgi:hypothetical protein
MRSGNQSLRHDETAEDPGPACFFGMGAKQIDFDSFQFDER